MSLVIALLRRAVAIFLLGLSLAAIWSTAQREGFAARSAKWRSDQLLQASVAQKMSANLLRKSAREIAHRDPMQSISFVFQVMASELDNNPDTAKNRPLIAEAARRQPAFAAPRIWVTADDINMGRYAKAVNGADVVMRLNGEFRKLLLPVLLPLLDNPEAAPLLNKKLLDFPVWRTDFVAAAVKAGGYDQHIERMLTANPPSRYANAMAAERSSYLQKLVSQDEAERAFKLWQTFPLRSAKSAIADGQFSETDPVFPFAWRFAADSYSYAEKVAASGGMDAVVRAHHGGEGRAVLLTQLLGLRAGPHVLTFLMRDGGLSKPEKLFWRLRCLNSETDLARESLAKLEGNWQNMLLRVHVPEHGCAMQYLTLEADDNDGDEAEVEIRSVGAA